MRNQVILRRATTGRPYKIRMESVHRDDVKITRKCAYFCDLLAFFVVGATSGRPLCISRSDVIENAFPAQTFSFPQTPIRRKNPSLPPIKRFWGLLRTFPKRSLTGVRGGAPRIPSFLPAHPLHPRIRLDLQKMRKNSKNTCFFSRGVVYWLR